MPVTITRKMLIQNSWRVRRTTSFNKMHQSLLPFQQDIHYPPKSNHKVSFFDLTWITRQWKHKGKKIPKRKCETEIVNKIFCRQEYGAYLLVSFGTISTTSLGLKDNALSINLFARLALTPNGGLSPII